MVHIYCGDGKGKTTAAMGLAVRAVGRDLPAVVAQFLKSDDSGERSMMREMPGLTLVEIPDEMKFTFAMTEKELAAETKRQQAIYRQAIAMGELNSNGILVLDELCAALSKDMVALEDVLAFLDERPAKLEVVITGRNPPQALMDKADYITEMKKIRHPFDEGQRARRGIEY